MITSTSFNQTVLAKVNEAMRKASGTNRRLARRVQLGMAYVGNRRGKLFLRVSYSRGAVGAFRFYDACGNDVTSTVLTALRRAQ